jgi:hypothetical protein
MRIFVNDQASGLASSPEGRANAPEGHAKKIATGICIIFRGLFLEHNADIGKKTIYGWTLNQQ